MAAKRDWVFTLDKKKLQFLAKLAWAWYIVFQKDHMLGRRFPCSAGFSFKQGRMTRKSCRKPLKSLKTDS
jgi:hypothetical protein